MPRSSARPMRLSPAEYLLEKSDRNGRMIERNISNHRWHSTIRNLYFTHQLFDT